MRISIFVACLALLYGTCRIYAEESVNLIEKATHDISKRQNVALTKSLSRHERSILMSPLHEIRSSILPIRIGLNMLEFPFRSVLDLMNFAQSIMFGEDLCPKVEKVEKLSVDLIDKIIMHPIKAIKIIMCYFMNAIGSNGRAMMLAITPYLSKFVFKIFLPGMHTILNQLIKTGMLPQSVEDMIKMFNAFYMILQMLGYVST